MKKKKIVRRLARSMNGVEHRKEKISFVINSMCAYASQKKNYYVSAIVY